MYVASSRSIVTVNTTQNNKHINIVAIVKIISQKLWDIKASYQWFYAWFIGFGKKVHVKKGPRKKRPQLEKTSTEITSTRKKRPLGNKVHLERVEKKGHESRKIGP